MRIFQSTLDGGGLYAPRMHNVCSRTSCRIKGVSVAKPGKRVVAYPDDQGSITTLTRDDGRACA